MPKEFRIQNLIGKQDKRTKTLPDPPKVSQEQKHNIPPNPIHLLPPTPKQIIEGTAHNFPMPPTVINELKTTLIDKNKTVDEIVNEAVARAIGGVTVNIPKRVQQTFENIEILPPAQYATEIINDCSENEPVKTSNDTPQSTTTTTTTTSQPEQTPQQDAPKTEPLSNPTATKQTLRICDQMNVEVHVLDDLDDDDQIQSEMDTITLKDPILPYEECIVSIVPKANLPIKQVISAYLSMDKANINFDLCHIVLDINEGDKSFQMCIKNKGEMEHTIKIQYHVIF